MILTGYDRTVRSVAAAEPYIEAVILPECVDRAHELRSCLWERKTLGPHAVRPRTSVRRIRDDQTKSSRSSYVVR